MKKKVKGCRRLYGSFAALSMAMSLVNVPMGIQAEEIPAEPAEVSVYPRPQSVDYDGTEGMKLEGPVDVVVHGTENEVVLNRLKTILDEEEIEYEVKEQASSDHAAIILSDDADHCDSCASTLEGTTHEQGYALVSDDDVNAKGVIVITGHDKDGVYNGVLTLGQMLDQKTTDGRIAEVAISDYPDMLLRGAIEGFYGIPWSFENRKEIIRDTAKVKMNTYIYAPKDDPYHKDQWKVLYPEEEAGHIKELVDEARENNMEFIWCVHPGNGFNYSNDNDYNTLIAKLEQLYSLGVRQFGISYDDLGGDGDGANQANVINRASRYLKEKYGDVKNMLTVGKRYTDGWGSSWQGYLKPFLDNLDDDVTVMWTGKNTGGVCGKNSFNGPKNQVGYDKPLAFWFNYPVNDMKFGRLLMGEMDSSLLDPEVTGLAGFYMNPMNQAQASKVSLNQGADFSWNTAGYQSHESWLRAIEEVAGKDHAEAFSRFADNTSSHVFEDVKVGESKVLQPKLAALDSAIASGQGIREAALAVKAEYEQMIADAAELKTIEDPLLLADIESHVNAYEELGKGGLAAMNGLLAALDLDSNTMNECQTEAAEHLATANTFMVDVLDRNGGTGKEKAECGEKYIKPFLSTAGEKMNAAFRASLSTSSPARIISSDDSATGTISSNQGNPSATLNATLPYGGYAGFSLSQLTKVASFTCELPEETRLEYSSNGADWNTWTAESGNVDVTYVRVVNESRTPLSLKDFAISAESVFKPVESMTASTNVSGGACWETNTISKAVDGDYSTKYWSNSPASDDDYIQIDLGTVVPVGAASITFGGNPKGASNGIDGFSETSLQVSTDGSIWETVGDSLPVAQYESVTENNTTMARASFNGNGKLGRYVRFVATKAHDTNWIQVYEVNIEQNGGTGDSTVNIGSTNTSGNIGSLCDGNLNSAFTVDNPAEGDHVIYNLSTVTSAKDLLVLQSSVSNGKLSVQNYDGTWEEVGTLDALNNTKELNKRIKAVRIDFEAGTPAAIQEVIVRPTDTPIKNTIMPPVMDGEVLDYTFLQAAVNKARTLKEDDFSTDFAVLDFALENGEDMLTAAQTQDDVDGAALVLNEALLDLRLNVSKTELDKLN